MAAFRARIIDGRPGSGAVSAARPAAQQVPLDDALAAVAQRVVERLTNEAPHERAIKLLTDALLLTGLRVRRELALKIFRGIRMMQESDTYLMILEEGEARQAKKDILVVGEERLGVPAEPIKAQLDAISDLERLECMHRRAVKAASWQEILATS